MLVYRHINGFFDVFSGEGWETRTLIQRVKRDGKAFFRYIEGQRLPQPVVKLLNEKIDPTKQRQTIQE